LAEAAEEAIVCCGSAIINFGLYSEDPQTSETVAALIRLCYQQDLYLVARFSEKRKDKVYNSALLIGSRGVQSIYRKLHLFNNEKQCFDPGDLPLTVQEVRGTRR
jgi:predicted amidohydrolase